jgi:potassium-transporting ATPase KdpC subunit
MMRLLLQSARAVALGTLVLGVAYPLAVTAVAGLLFPRQANGSLVERDGRAVGSALLGQQFEGSRWFHGRPSATAPVPYEPTAGCGSNLSPRNPALAAAVRARITALRAADPTLPERLPVDWVTSSGSGLDPHVSLRTALLQVPRVADARGLDRARVEALVRARSEARLLGLFGEPRVEVLGLNLALDEFQ